MPVLQFIYAVSVWVYVNCTLGITVLCMVQSQRNCVQETESNSTKGNSGVHGHVSVYTLEQEQNIAGLH